MKTFVVLSVLLSLYYVVAMQVATTAVNDIGAIYQKAEAIAATPLDE